MKRKISAMAITAILVLSVFVIFMMPVSAADTVAPTIVSTTPADRVLMSDFSTLVIKMSDNVDVDEAGTTITAILGHEQIAIPEAPFTAFTRDDTVANQVTVTITAPVSDGLYVFIITPRDTAGNTAAASTIVIGHASVMCCCIPLLPPVDPVEPPVEPPVIPPVEPPVVPPVEPPVEPPVVPPVEPEPEQIPGFTAIFAILGLLAVAYRLRRREE